ncbi:hypothetical protein BpHYR1_011957 [Brachionus plicatilis]|uniref:Uncharacterized protein n=1 Tax=Brachionus plicatilis TaxID=10195 RepID=A0A3M7PUQ1_BRAPC|nr:hypothetical protein BpHYR1_011957 [Brachionus plicatilis]
MEAWQTVKEYISDSYSFITNEAWQLGADTKSGFGSLYTDIVTETSDVFVDIANSITWGQEQEPEKVETPVEELETSTKSAFLEDVNISNKEKIEVFAVESFPSKQNPEIVNVNDSEKKKESNF